MNIKPKKKVIALVLVGVMLAIFGLVFYVSFPHIMKWQIKQKLILTKGTEAYHYWENIPIPIYIRFYFFNVTNPMDVYNNHSKPILEELGPYTFRESREKVDIYWTEDETLTYRQIKRWHYQPDLTHGNLSDVITTINVPMVAAAAMAKKKDSYFMYAGLSFVFSETGSSWFVSKPVHQLLFDGYEDPLIDQAHRYADIPYDKFGWFYKRNGTDDGEFNIFTGATGLERYDEVNTWNGVTNVTSYDPPCNMINGSAGDMWPPFREEGGTADLFVTDICRSLRFSFLEKRTIKGLDAYRYWADNHELDNGKSNPENKCFCIDGQCYPAGAIDVSRCKMDAPAVVSYPHFLYADSVYSQGVIGLKPDPKKHMMYVDIQKDMGIPLGVAARMQINIVFQPVKHIPQFSNFTETTYYPAIWFSETADVDDAIADKLKFVLNTLPTVVTATSFFSIGLGALLIIAAFILVFMYPKKADATCTSSGKNYASVKKEDIKKGNP